MHRRKSLTIIALPGAAARPRNLKPSEAEMGDITGAKNGEYAPPKLAEATIGDPYTLSGQDRVLLDCYVSPFIVYKLPSDANRQLIIDSMQRGLDKAAEQLPALAATIHLDSMGRALPRISPCTQPLKLSVRTFGNGEFMSYSELAQRSFPPADFASSLAPDGVQSLPAKERQSCFIQLNFIPGGIIFCVALNHMIVDGASVGFAISLICQCTKACMENASIPQHDYCYDRRPFLPSADWLASKSKEELIAANDRHQTLKYIVDPPASYVNPSTTRWRSMIYRISASDAKRLKSLCKTVVDGVGYVSTYD